MLCYAYAMLCYAMLCYAMLCDKFTEISQDYLDYSFTCFDFLEFEQSDESE